ncbi:PREDICTED: uncharacterized protein LOC108691868 [Atta colombica]|uniref:uncharacterized protein LOC108691868 n=1 Tax=Atta colombica TaxID=520822 RepID=UPI00084C9617|nr:PREDICTED: uncharacterized protein LOC108691868 [Atta colombica]
MDSMDVKTLEMLGNYFGSDTLKKTAVYEWHERFKSDRESVEDDERSSRSTSKTDENINKFSWITNDIVHHEFLPEGQTVNKEYYLDVMRRLREAVHQKRKDLWANNSWILHHDNAPSHGAHHYP